MTKHPFIPIILGTDINAYNMAISFHEEYGICPILVGKLPMSFTTLSSIIKHIELDSNFHDNEVFLNVMEKVAINYAEKDKKMILIGTNDFYVRLITENSDELAKNYLFNYIPETLMNDLLVKSNFYKLCAEHNIEAPTTHIYSCRDDKPFGETMLFPVIIKPSNGVEYYKNSFEGQQKVYKVDSHQEIQSVIDTIKSSGYKEELVIQDYIPGDDTYMWDSVIYMNSRGKAELVTFGQVVLQEHTVTAIGNYTAVITRYNEEMMLKLKGFLEDINYVGFANFDLKYDKRDGKFKVFEVNIRQGRSSYYITQCGHNMAKYFVDDLIYNKEKPLTLLDEEFLFTVVPKIVLKKFVTNPEIKNEVKMLLKEKKFGNPLFYKKDRNFKRKFYLFIRQINYYRKYRNSNW